MSAEPQLTPMMAQYLRIKGELPPDALLLFRLGDFYEMFFEDAIEGARLLNVALTKRGTTPMCGIPFHAANGYIAKILRGGRKVAICDQVEEARPGQLVKREVTQILSPGTHFDDRILTAERNNFLAAVRKSGEVFGIAMVDLTTGDFRVTEAPNEQALQAELERLRPAELIYPDNDSSLAVMVSRAGGIALPHEGWVFEPETAAHTLREHFKVAALDGYGLRGKIAGTGAAGAALHYLRQHLRRDVAHLTGLAFYLVSDHLVLDSTTLRHLEVVEPLHEGARESTLFAALNRTTTPMGARLLRDWLTRPLCAVPAIVRRQDAVAAFQRLPEALEPLRTHLKEVRDLQRTLSRLSVGSGNARDLVSVGQALQEIPALRELAGRVAVAPPEPVAHTGEIFGEEPASLTAVELLVDLQNALHPLPELVEELTKALADEPPLALKEGGIIRDGYSPDLDELRSAGRDGKDWIARLQQAEIEKTGPSF